MEPPSRPRGGGCLSRHLQEAAGCSPALGSHSPGCNDLTGPCLYHLDLDLDLCCLLIPVSWRKMEPSHSKRGAWMVGWHGDAQRSPLFACRYVMILKKKIYTCIHLHWTIAYFTSRQKNATLMYTYCLYTQYKLIPWIDAWLCASLPWSRPLPREKSGASPLSWCKGLVGRMGRYT